MRKAFLAVVGVWAAIAVSTLFARRATRHDGANPSIEPRIARDAYLARHALTAAEFARVASLWGEGVGQCRVTAVWGEKPAQASFASLMRVRMRPPQLAAAAAETAAWVSREQLQVAANDADIAKRYVTIEPGASPVVRILKAASFRPRRATFGDQAIAA